MIFQLTPSIDLHRISTMVYLVGGYILTYEQVYAFADFKHFEIPDIGMMLCPNRWLRSKGVPFRLLAV